MTAENSLRADAPVFIPSFGLQNDRRTDHLAVNSTKGKTRRKRGNRSKNQSQRSAESDTLDKKQHNQRPKRRDVRHGTQRKKTGKDHRRSSRPKSVHHDQENEQNDKVEEPLLPLNAEITFPSLTSETSNNKEPSNSIWTNSLQGTDIFQPIHHSTGYGSVDEDDFSRLGLSKLKPRISRDKNLIETQKNRNSSPSNTSRQNYSIEPNQQDAADNGSNARTNQTQPRINSRRPKWNMDRLRDRWWETLTSRRHRRELLNELDSILRGRIVYPSTEETASSESSVTSDNTCLDLVDIKSLHQESNGSPNKSALHHLFENTAPGLFSSQVDVLNDVIQRNDDQALSELLCLHRDGTLSDSLKEVKVLPNDADEGRNEALAEMAVYACVEYDKPHLLRIVKKHTISYLSHYNMSKQETRKQQTTALMLAAALGHTECLSLLVSTQERNSNIISSRDQRGNNVFHYCCRGEGDESSLRLLLKDLSGGAKWKQQQLSRSLLAKNDSQKTPLHTACEHGRVDLVEAFLSICSTGLLSKMLSMTDGQGQTPLLAAVAANSSDVVICLIMWRGNQNVSLRKPQQAPHMSLLPATAHETEWPKSELPSCPLAWAAGMGNLEMVLVLLQFTDCSGSDYRVTEAISAFLRSSAPHDIKIEGARVLIQAGGNPFLDINPPNSVGKPETAVHVACKSGFPQGLRTLVETGKQELVLNQQSRRRDPKLRQQPESFFQGLEGSEDAEMNTTLRNALIDCLINGLKEQEAEYNEQSMFLPCAVILYKLGTQLGEIDFVELQKGLNTTGFPITIGRNDQCFVTSYLHYITESHKKIEVSNMDRSKLACSSQLLYQTAWMKDELDRGGCKCSWMGDNLNIDDTGEDTSSLGDRVVFAAGSAKFVIHDSVVGPKSTKLASAIRFAKMNDDLHKDNEIPEIALDIDPRLFMFLLQHIYHGSICTGWSLQSDQVCRDILDLMVIAEEFLCPSLAQECEMRLLSANPTACFCWACSKNVRPMSIGDGRFAECIYCVEGPGSLLTGDSLLDVLAATQYLEHRELDYRIGVLPTSLFSSNPVQTVALMSMARKERSSGAKAIHLLRSATIQMILSKFASVIESDSFKASIELNSIDFQGSVITCPHEVLLLQTCLEELFGSRLPATPLVETGIVNQTERSNIHCEK
eukprot:scaffold7344_cov145-Cylindrotheca_fusiformis.AAC.13